MPIARCWSVLLALCLLVLTRLLAAAEPAAAAPLSTPLMREDLDPAAFACWVAGTEAPVPLDQQAAVPPTIVIWTQNSRPEWCGVPAFGRGNTLGPRHLRIGFTKAITVGSLLTAGNCRVSVLKPEAAYPGDLADDAQWQPAERLAGDQIVTTGSGYRVWCLPPATQTRALRFTHEPRVTDATYAGFLGGVYVLSERLVNVAPQARTTASVNEQKLGSLTNEKEDTWGAWDNWDDARPPKPVATDAPWVMLVWPSPVSLRGLASLFGGFGQVEVQTYAGPASQHPRDAAEADWQTVKTFDHLHSWYPLRLPVQWLAFDQVLVTSALRLRFTQVAPEDHPHLNGNTKNGRRVWLDELLALQPLGDAPLTTAVRTPLAAAAPHPPIPVRFTLKEPSFVTLVIDDAQGHRLRNLVSATPYPAGDNVAWWDGMDDLGRDADAATHGLYHVPGHFVAPGTYTVRGLRYPAIDLLYEFPVYTAGQPAWNTADNTGAWLSNHTAPTAALAVPADRTPTGQELVYLGSPISEGTHGLAWVDLTGRKVGGVNWVGGNWTGAPYLACDRGPQADTSTVLFAGAAFEGELRLTALARANHAQRSVFKTGAKADGQKFELGGLAARNGLLVVSLPSANQLLFIDAAGGKQVAAAPLPAPQGLAFDAQGRLLVISEQHVLRYTLATPPAATLPAAEVLVSSGLEAPAGLTVDDAGQIYVSDLGTSHQVKVFAADGTSLRVVGVPGAPAAGPYNPLHMNQPAGLSVDSQGRLWVAERDDQPKRISVWHADGKLDRAFYGPAEYGGGGTLDPQDKTLFYYRGMAFRLDWKKGVDRLETVYWRPASGPSRLPDGHMSNGPPQLPLYAHRHQYFANCYNSNPTNGAGIVTLWITRKGLAVPCAVLGTAHDWSLLKTEPFLSCWPAGVDPKGDRWRNQAFCLWSDRNDDGEVQPDEVQMFKADTGGITIASDLAAVVARVNGNTTRYTPVAFTPGGAPVYDFAKGEVLATEVHGPLSSGGDQALAHPDGWTVMTVVPKPYSPMSVAGVYKGEPRWSYPDLWPGLHAAHEAAVPDRPGMLIGTTRLLGDFITPRRGDAGPLWCVNGNMGPMYLFTADGLLVASLFQDVRQGASWSMPLAQRGMNLNGVTPHDENFWPSITQTRDGEVYIVDGARTSLVHVTGLDGIRRFSDSKLQVTAADLEKAQREFLAQEAARQADQGHKRLRVARLPAAPTVDGKLDEWDADWVVIDKRGTAAYFNSQSRPYDVRAAMAIAGDRLYLAFSTGDKQLLRNSGEQVNALFKTGSALDLMLETAGASSSVPAGSTDFRLLVTQVKDKCAAVLYRPVVPGTDKAARVPFSSPWRTVYFDAVTDVSEQVQLAGADGNYEVSVPLALLGWSPTAGSTCRGDLGILRGDGFQTLQRIYWSNKATGITSDVPSEAVLVPALWGELQVE